MSYPGSYNKLFEPKINMSSNQTLFFEILFGYVVVVALFWLFYKNFLTKNIYLNQKKRHGWKSIQILNRSCYCSVCEMLLCSSTGQFCDSCGICCDEECLAKADKLIKCKQSYAKFGKPIKHIWIRGNLSLNSICNLCKDDIDYLSTPGLYGYRCCWCQRCFHDECFILSNEMYDHCDFGTYKDLIIPPSSIKVRVHPTTRKLYLFDINPPKLMFWKPLIIIANTRSGSSTASDFVSLMRGVLHPLQVFELGKHGPLEPLQVALKTCPKQTRILIAGGDGTIGWVLNTILDLGINPLPQVAIMPLGTGNDLSRIMGWGGTPPSTIDPLQLLRKIRRAKCVNLDRWAIEIGKTRYRLPFHRLKTIHMYNYFSIGVDALVALNFHKARESPYYLLSSRVINKMMYACFGTQQVIQQECENIQKRLKLYLDDELIELPELQSVIFLNIDSWGAGVKLCKLSETENDISDGIIEVFGIVSSFHIAQLQVGLGRPIRLGRASNIKIKIFEPCPVQADGEPWVQSRSEIHLKTNGQVKMLKNE